MSRVRQERHHQQTHPHPHPTWPLAEYSRTVECGGMHWHVQRLGEEGSTILLLHGTGASTHSWREVASRLAVSHRVIMCDLPGHGFTSRPASSGMSLGGMSRLLSGLLQHLHIDPDYLIGHSAGAALCCQLVLERAVQPKCIVSVNGAMQPFNGLAGQVFSPLAQLLSANPVVPRLVSWKAKNSALASRLLNDTGSVIDAEGKDLYVRLLRNPEHVAGALSMMAHWNLDPLWRRLPRLQVPLHLIVGSNDKTVSPRQASLVSQRTRFATVTRLEGLGHLAHEEAPDTVHQLMQSLLHEQGSPLPDKQAVAIDRH